MYILILINLLLLFGSKSVGGQVGEGGGSYCIIEFLNYFGIIKWENARCGHRTIQKSAFESLNSFNV